MIKRLALAATLLAGSALAQTTPVAPTSAAPAPTQANASAIPPAPVPAPETWMPRGFAELAGLDKITARVTPLAARVGQSLAFGTLSVMVRSCIVRGPDVPPDQAAYLDITDSRDPSVSFHGWMLLSEPSLSMLEHPVYDIRLTACRA